MSFVLVIFTVTFLSLSLLRANCFETDIFYDISTDLIQEKELNAKTSSSGKALKTLAALRKGSS